MSFPSLPDHFTLDFNQNWQHRVQRMPSLLRGTVSTETINGERKRFSQLEKQEMRQIVARAGTTNVDEATGYFRHLICKKFELANILDEWDEKELGVLVSPQGALVTNHGYAYNRAVDATIIAAIEGNAITGEDGTTLTPVPQTQIVEENYVFPGTAANVGLTFAKVARARRIFTDNDIPAGDGNLYAVISPADDEALVRDVDEIKNSDYSRVAPIADGTVNGKSWMGFKWIVHTGLTTASNVTNCLFYHKDFVAFADGERRASVDILPEKSHAIQIRTRARMGAMRREEKGVVIVQTYYS